MKKHYTATLLIRSLPARALLDEVAATRGRQTRTITALHLIHRAAWRPRGSCSHRCAPQRPKD